MKLYIKKTKNKSGIKEMLWVDFTHEGVRYRKPLKLSNTVANKKLAETKIMPQLQLKLVSGEFFKNQVPTVEEAMKKSFLLQSGNRSQPVQYDYDLKYKKHIQPVFGHMKIDLIKPTDITLWQNRLRDENQLSVKTIKQIRGLLYTMYEDMIADELEIKNPIKRAGKLSNRSEVVKEKVPFNLIEIDRILRVATPQLKNLYALLFYTGLRGGEALALKWEEVDFEKKSIYINLQVRKSLFSSPKWGSVRTVPMIDVLVPFLQEQYKLTKDKGEFVFLNTQKTNYWDISKIRENHWKKDLQKAEVVYRTIHTTRSTFISTLISNGEDINYVSKIAGHKNVSMTLEKYSKYIPQKNDNFGKCFVKSTTPNDTIMAPNNLKSLESA